ADPPTRLVARIISAADQWRTLDTDVTTVTRSPFWTEIGIFNADGKRTENIPNKGGYFELALPNALFKDNPESLHLDWIDFYRG
ncbi:MAG: hypothetical protein WBF93_03680, partial [Pirellulales bacterium]